ncbi:TonB-dependent receptor [Lysobacter sp. H23M47]|uniref:TonB-dependent receptor domain-containing protein n=1 Tax=Lysobacter sp. H23M47 TaxID=2781024 RepID=UPI00187FA4B1|nr:TonB-dependent receptor [Lysobacter sp. H23M47]QOW23734.1 TonB-dependent receptor [Lysobacter sp. H23M47]
MSHRSINTTRSQLSVALFAAMLLPMAGAAFAQDTTTNDEPTPAETQRRATDIDTVVVTGSRIKRAEIEGPAPVTVITRADIEREGFQTVGDMLQTITQNTTSSFTGDLAVSGFTPNAQVINLRNLGPGYTLTLIDGRRPAQYPQPYNRDNNVVNVRAIPSSIIERVEILTGGASAIYGSDAVAGVVNIVTRKNFEGNTAKVTAGTTTNGGGDSVDLELSGGRSGDRWTAVYALQYGENEPVFANQRDFLADSRKGPDGAEFANPSLSLVMINGTGWNAPAGHNLFYPGEATCDAFGYTTKTTPLRGKYCGSFTQPSSRSISNKYRYYSAYGSGTFDINDSLQAFGSATFYKSDAKSSSGTEFWGTSGDRFTSNASGAASTYYYDPQFDELVQLQRVFNPFELGGNEAATTLYDETYFDVSAGFMGTLGETFDWEATVSHSAYEYEADRPRLLAKSVHDYFLGPQLGYAYGYPVYELDLDRWSTPFTPDQYRAVATRVVNKSKTSSSTVNFNINGDLFELPAGTVGFAGVLEAARQTLDLQSDPRTDQLRPLDDQTIYNLTSSGRTDGKRDRYAIGAELRVPILDSLTMNLAARYDKYDDITAVDDAVTYMGGLEWRPFSSLLLRGSYSTSFRAPDMQLVFAEGAASYSTILDEYQCRSGTGAGEAAGPRTRAECNASGDPTIYQTQTVIAGNPLLEEEEGTSWGGGFVWDMTDGMSLSVDYYKIRLDNQALQLSASKLLRDEANCRLGVQPDGSPSPNPPGSAYCQNVESLITRLNAPDTALDGRIQRINSAYINAALTETSGIDATYRYRWDTDQIGAFTLDMAYTLVLTDRYKQFREDPLIDYRDDLGNQNQRSRVRGSLSWRKDDWTTTVFGTRFGSNGNWVEDAGTNKAGESYGPRLRPYMLYNLQVAKKLAPNLEASATVVNVFDNQYRYDASQTGYPFFNNYIGADPLGRRVFVSVAYKF